MLILFQLPDYHDVIEHPMDFATVRKKLGNGSYSNLEQFESDVLLICSNAMQYNATDTIYYKQAFSIQELAKQKFQRLRLGAEHYEKQLQSEQKPTSNSLGTNKQTKTPITQIAPETVAFDLSSGATFAASGDFQLGSAAKAGGFERLSNVDESVDGTASQSDNNLDKAEDLPSVAERGHISGFGRKPVVHDDNRRATYNISTQPGSQLELVFFMFNGEIKQLVAAGLHAEHSHARSLACFAAMLGPIAWNIASKMIERALPPGFKFGRGWVGDYEPISKPVLVMQKCCQKETVFCKRFFQS